jgi:hypothetical protein
MYETPESCTAEFIRSIRPFLAHSSNEGEPSLQAFAVGFLVHVIGQEEIAVTALDVPGWTHCYRILVPADCLADDGSSGLFHRDGDISWVDPSGWDVTLTVEDGTPLKRVHGRLNGGIPVNPTDARSWEIIDLVPDFAEFCIGARLARGWSTRPGVLSTLRLTSGMVSSVPTAGTYQYSWSWTGKDGQRCRQPITDVLRCESQAPKGASLDFRERGGARTVSVKLQPGTARSIRVFMVSVPEGWDRSLENTLSEYHLELTHLHATLRICEWAEDVRGVLNAAPHQIPSNLRPKTPGSLAPFLDMCRPGRVNCGGRTLSAL